MAKNIAVFGLYDTAQQMEQGIAALRDGGFRPTDVSVLYPENLGNKDLAYEKGSKAPEGATTGAVSGAVVGGTLGWLAGIGLLAIPGLGPFIAAGPIMAALAGLGAGATVGGVGGAMVGMGIPEYEAKRYEGRVTSGAYLVSVHCDSSEWVERAQQVLAGSGAQDISSTSESGADYNRTDRPVYRRAAGGGN